MGEKGCINISIICICIKYMCLWLNKAIFIYIYNMYVPKRCTQSEFNTQL